MFLGMDFVNESTIISHVGNYSGSPFFFAIISLFKIVLGIYMFSSSIIFWILYIKNMCSLTVIINWH